MSKPKFQRRVFDAKCNGWHYEDIEGDTIIATVGRNKFEITLEGSKPYDGAITGVTIRGETGSLDVRPHVSNVVTIVPRPR